MAQAEVIYLGIKGQVLALSRVTGETIWTQALIGGDYVSVVLDGDQLLATTKGEIFCLDGQTGQVRWHNRLTGFGRGLISVATVNTQQELNAAELIRQQQAAVAAAAAVAASS
jgi:outer membrane protein assembly factor BamB